MDFRTTKKSIIQYIVFSLTVKSLFVILSLNLVFCFLCSVFPGCDFHTFFFIVFWWCMLLVWCFLAVLWPTVWTTKVILGLSIIKHVLRIQSCVVPLTTHVTDFGILNLRKDWAGQGHKMHTEWGGYDSCPVEYGLISVAFLLNLTLCIGIWSDFWGLPLGFVIIHWNVVWFNGAFNLDYKLNLLEIF